MCGLRGQLAYERLALALYEWASEQLPWPREAWGYWAFMRAQEHAVRGARLGWLAEQAPSIPPVALQHGGPVEQLDPDVLVGVHALEQWEGRSFRWTEPVSILRFAPANATTRVVIDTGGLRGRPGESVLGVFVGKRRIRPTAISDDGERLAIALADADARAMSADGLLLACEPLRPRRHGSADERRLGMPIFSIELS